MSQIGQVTNVPDRPGYKCPRSVRLQMSQIGQVTNVPDWFGPSQIAQVTNVPNQFGPSQIALVTNVPNRSPSIDVTKLQMSRIYKVTNVTLLDTIY